MQIFEVGGCIRDEILGIPSKDIDFSCVLDDEFADDGFNRQGNTPFEVMTLNLKRQGFKIFLETPEHFTVRAQFPATIQGFPTGTGKTADFVLARVEGPYNDGRRPDWVKPGTLEDDLNRRDFTMNAIAKDSEGNLIDPHNGVAAIKEGCIYAVGNPHDRMEEDALRAVRALRFSVTKGFHIAEGVQFAMQTAAVLDRIVNQISDERITDELSKMFKFSTMKSLFALQRFPSLTEAMFAGKVSLDATMKTKGRGK